MLLNTRGAAAVRKWRSFEFACRTGAGILLGMTLTSFAARSAYSGCPNDALRGDRRRANILRLMSLTQANGVRGDGRDREDIR